MYEPHDQTRTASCETGAWGLYALLLAGNALELCERLARPGTPSGYESFVLALQAALCLALAGLLAASLLARRLDLPATPASSPGCWPPRPGKAEDLYARLALRSAAPGPDTPSGADGLRGRWM